MVMYCWFGLVSGLVEGLLWLNFRHLHSPDILWIAPGFNFLLFAFLGLGICFAARFVKNLRVDLLALFIPVWLSLFPWIRFVDHPANRRLADILVSLACAVLLTFWLSRHRQRLLRLQSVTLPWVAGIALLGAVFVQLAAFGRELSAISRLAPLPQDSPNVILIVVDTLRADHLASQGYPRPTSPNIDRLASEGVQFRTAISPSSWTIPAMGSLLTGRSPGEHGAVDVEDELVGTYPTVGEFLQSRGYLTAAFSANTYNFTPRGGFGRGFIRFDWLFRSVSTAFARTYFGSVANHRLIQLGLKKQLLGRRSAEDVNSAVLHWINKYNRPFFVVLNYFDTHDPYLPPEPYLSRFARAPAGGRINSIADILPTLTPQQLQAERDAYDGAIAYVDDCIGQLLAELKTRGRLANTLVIVTSDHGESFGEHGLLAHAHSLHWELIHVPLIFWWPDHLPAGVRIDQPVSTAALPLTLSTLLSRSDGRSSPFPGPSLAALWSSPSPALPWPEPRSELAHLRTPPSFPSSHGSSKSLVRSNWHCILHERFGLELYDWTLDPDESRNRFLDPALGRVRSLFESQLQK
jgi:arylsulfatase A-like enzyme